MIKNYFIGFLCLSFVVVSCKKERKLDKQETVVKIVDSAVVDSSKIVEEKKLIKKKPLKKKVADKKKTEKDIIPVPSGAPSFKNTEARKYINDYERYISNYKKAIESDDMDSFIELSEASNSLTKQYRSLVVELSPDELAMMSTYVQAKSRQVDALSKSL